LLLRTFRKGEDVRVNEKKAKPHDEAMKKLLQTFFAEFIELFFPELDALLDHGHTRFLMQELLVDIVGEEAKVLDLLLETRYRKLDACILLHLEPQAYPQKDFRERMFIYFARLFERHRKEHKLIIPIAIFLSDEGEEEPDVFEMALPEREILRFSFLKVELKKLNWRRFVSSDNPVAAALLVKMGYNKKEKREIRAAYLRMILRLRIKQDEARMALLMSVADIYFEPDRTEDEEILLELMAENPEESEAVMELMPAWKRWGYEEGVQEGLEKGIEQGIEKGMETERAILVRRMLAKGFTPEQVADTLDLAVSDVRKLQKH